MAARTPTPCGSRAALLLRLQADAALACAELHPRGALLLAGSEAGEALVFATSTGNLLQARLGAGARGSIGSPPPPHLPPPPPPSCRPSLLPQRLADPSAKPSPVTSVAWAEVAGVEHVVAGHKNGSVRVWRLDGGAGEPAAAAAFGRSCALRCLCTASALPRTPPRSRSGGNASGAPL